jgi:NAD-dependent epimerase/dehydratase family protein
MRIFLTGGTGRVGAAAVARLLAAGHTLTVVGRRPALEVGAASYSQCDVNDFQTLQALMTGHDAVVHLAAITNPVSSPGRELMRVNLLGTFNVYEAAAECGISRVVCASSINALGYFFGDRGFPIRYLPIDESHPVLATDAYSFSKQSMERTGEYFWERDRISGTMLRLPAVYGHERLIRAETPPSPEIRDLVHELLDMPEQSRLTEVERLHTGFDRFRATHRLDKIPDGFAGWRRAHKESGLEKRETVLMGNLIANFFCYIDELDSAQAIEKSLIGEYDGCHPLFVNARRNQAGVPLAELAKLYWPVIPEIREQEDGDDCLVSIDRARKLIGFDPEWVLKP